jgi:uncharacterized membrane protein
MKNKSKVKNRGQSMRITEKGQSIRIAGLDILRGIAVILMVQQHTGFWFWNNKGSMAASMGEYPLMVIINGLGGLAAPLFILLAGTGSALFASAGAKPAIFIKRGIIILIFGYILNFLTPSWFSPGSWYVLHLIGAGLILIPLLLKVPDKVLFIITGAIIAATPLLLAFFNLSRYFSNEMMAAFSGFGDILCHAAISGNFPVFPWMALFVTGFVSGKWIVEGNYSKIIKAAAFTAASALILVIIKYSGFPFIHVPLGKKIFVINLYMYPAYPVQFLFLSFLALVSLYMILMIDKKYGFSSGNIVALTGRVSLTIFMLHIVIIRNFMVHSGYWKSFSAMEASALQIAVLLFIFAAIMLWRKADFKYGFEWLLRKAGN